MCCLFVLFITGIWTVNTYRHASYVAGGLRNRSRVHVCDPQAATDDHVGGGQGAHPDLPKFARSTDGFIGRPAHVRDRLRGDRAQLQHRRRRLQSKAISVRPRPPRACSFRSPADRPLRARPGLDAAAVPRRPGLPTFPCPILSAALRPHPSFPHPPSLPHAYDSCARATVVSSADVVCSAAQLLPTCSTYAYPQKRERTVIAIRHTLLCSYCLQKGKVIHTGKIQHMTQTNSFFFLYFCWCNWPQRVSVNYCPFLRVQNIWRCTSYKQWMLQEEMSVAHQFVCAWKN